MPPGVVDVRRPIGIEIEFEVLREGKPLFPKIKVLDEEGAIAFNAMDTDERWLQPTAARRVRRDRVDPGQPAERGLGDRRGRDLQHRLPEARAPCGGLRGACRSRCSTRARATRRAGSSAASGAASYGRCSTGRASACESRSNQPSPARDCRQHVRMARGSRCRLAVVRRAVRPAIHARRGRRRLGPRHEGARGRLANVLRRATRPRVATGRGVSPRPGPEPGRARGRRRLPRVHARGVDPAAPLRPRAPLVRRAGMVRRGPPRGRLSRPHTAHPRGAAPGASLGHARVAPFEAPGRLAPRSDASRSPPRWGSAACPNSSPTTERTATSSGSPARTSSASTGTTCASWDGGRRTSTSRSGSVGSACVAGTPGRTAR